MRIALAAGCLLLAACGSSSDDKDMATSLDLSVASADPAPAECDVLANTGCSANQKCTIGTDDGAPREICFPVAAAPVAEGGVCASVTMGARVGDNCAAGLSCVVYQTEGARCRRPCFLRSDCQGGSGCVVPTISNTIHTVDDAGQARLRTCHVDEGCDPVAQTICTGDRGCYLSTYDDQGRVGVCLTPAKQGMDGATCTTISDCAPGFRCDNLQFCRRYCYYETASGGIPTTGQCPANEGSCQLFPVEGDTYGICGAL